MAVDRFVEVRALLHNQRAKINKNQIIAVFLSLSGANYAASACTSP